jgi:uncharacterized tellurite resistance protein B-like protein
MSEMTPLENLHYAIGELAYAIAKADGHVQKEEQQKFHDMVVKELHDRNYSFSISEIIFQVMNKSKTSLSDSYHWALEQIKLNSHYLSPDLKQKFIIVMERVAAAYPPVTDQERALIQNFKRDIAPLKGDPVYYSKK